MPKLSSPIPYHGGKHYLADWIISKMPPHSYYIETHFGGGSVLFAKKCWGASEVVNDIDLHLTNFWRVLQSESLFSRFQRIIQAVPFSEVEFKQAESRLLKSDPVERAVGFFIQIRQSRNCNRQDFQTQVRSEERTGMRQLNEQVARWVYAVEGLPRVARRLMRVAVYSKDAVELIQQHDGPGVFFYSDPPYKKNTRESPDLYAHEYTDVQHLQLLNTLGGIKGRFLLSGYMSKMYADAATHYGWRLHKLSTTKHSSGVNNGERPKAIECLWCNY